MRSRRSLIIPAWPGLLHLLLAGSCCPQHEFELLTRHCPDSKLGSSFMADGRHPVALHSCVPGAREKKDLLFWMVEFKGKPSQKERKSGHHWATGLPSGDLLTFCAVQMGTRLGSPPNPRKANRLTRLTPLSLCRAP